MYRPSAFPAPAPDWKGGIPMADIGGMADKAKDAAKDNPEKVDQAKDKIKDTVDGNKDGDQK